MTDEDEARARITSEMAKKAAKERVAALKHDTDKLLKLSVELKEFGGQVRRKRALTRRDQEGRGDRESSPTASKKK